MTGEEIQAIQIVSHTPYWFPTAFFSSFLCTLNMLLFLFRQFIWNLPWQRMWLFEFNCTCVCERGHRFPSQYHHPHCHCTVCELFLKVSWATLPFLHGEVKFVKLLGNRSFLPLSKTMQRLFASCVESWDLVTGQSVKTVAHGMRKSVWLMQGRKWNQIQFVGLKEWCRGWNWHPPRADL